MSPLWIRTWTCIFLVCASSEWNHRGSGKSQLLRIFIYFNPRGSIILVPPGSRTHLQRALSRHPDILKFSRRFLRISKSFGALWRRSHRPLPEQTGKWLWKAVRVFRLQRGLGSCPLKPGFYPVAFGWSESRSRNIVLSSPWPRGSFTEESPCSLDQNQNLKRYCYCRIIMWPLWGHTLRSF